MLLTRHLMSSTAAPGGLALTLPAVRSGDEASRLPESRWSVPWMVSGFVGIWCGLLEPRMRPTPMIERAQFPVNPRRAPQSVRGRHLPTSAACTTARTPISNI